MERPLYTRGKSSMKWHWQRSCGLWCHPTRQIDFLNEATHVAYWLMSDLQTNHHDTISGAHEDLAPWESLPLHWRYCAASGLGLYYCMNLILSQSFQPMATQLSVKAALPLAESLGTASYYSSNTGPSNARLWRLEGLNINIETRISCCELIQIKYEIYTR